MKFRTSLETRALKRFIVGKNFLWFVRMVSSSVAKLPPVENLWYNVSNTTTSPNEIRYRFYIDFVKLIEYNFTLDALAHSCFKDIPVNVCVSPDFLGMIDLKPRQEFEASALLEHINDTVCGTPDILAVAIEGNIAVTQGSSILAVSRVQGIDKKNDRIQPRCGCSKKFRH